MTDDTLPKLCPRGHPVGTIFRSRRCSGKSCGEVKQAEVDARPRAFLQKMPEREIAYMEKAALSGMPNGLKGEEAAEWSEQKLKDMLPEAVAQVQWDLRFGNDKVKSEAADKVLRANGLDKREAGVSKAQPTIVLNISGGSVSAPWLQRMKKDDK